MAGAPQHGALLSGIEPEDVVRMLVVQHPSRTGVVPRLVSAALGGLTVLAAVLAAVQPAGASVRNRGSLEANRQTLAGQPELADQAGLAVAPAQPEVVLPAGPPRPEAGASLVQRFLTHLATLGPEFAAAEAVLRERCERAAGDQDADEFVLEALVMLYPDFGVALRAFDQDDYDAAGQRFAALLDHPDPYLSAHALYYYARGLAARGMTEELYELLERLDGKTDPALYSPYAPHLWFLRGHAAAAGLRFDEASAALQRVAEHYPDAPEPITIGARQLALEVERRERGTLDEVSALMDYAGHRLHVADAGERVRQRQEDAVAMLDKLIQDAQDREEQARQQSRNRPRPQPQDRPRQAAERSEAPPAAAGEIGELHGAPRADPGEMWGQLPPSEREKILQALQARFPSRYRQLVEQYYRSVAEQK